MWRVEVEAKDRTYSWGDLTWSQAWRIAIMLSRMSGKEPVFIYKQFER